MPQPFRKPANISNYGYAGGFMTDHYPTNPDVLAEAYKVIASWASIESRQLDYVILMLGGNTTVATAAYLSLEGKSAKSSFIRASAEKALDDTEREYLFCVLAVSKSLYSFRNKIAHWRNTRIKGYEDKLVLLNPELQHKTATSALDAMYVFTKLEMLDHRQRMEKIWQCYHYLICIHGKNRSGTSSKPDIDALYVQLRERLSSLDNQLQVPQYPPIQKQEP